MHVRSTYNFDAMHLEFSRLHLTSENVMKHQVQEGRYKLHTIFVT